MKQRIITSTKKIKEAYLELLFTEDYEKIFIKDICKKARVNRSTFYDRYGFIEALENEIIEEEVRKISFKDVQFDSLPLDPHGIKKESIKEYIDRFYNNKILMRFCTMNGREKFVDIIAHKHLDIAANHLTKISYYQAYFQCLGTLSTLIEWINDPKGQTIEDIVDIVYVHSSAMFGLL